MKRLRGDLWKTKLWKIGRIKAGKENPGDEILGEGAKGKRMGLRGAPYFLYIGCQHP